MFIAKKAFAHIYKDLFSLIYQMPVDIECRGKKIKYEICNAQLVFSPADFISIYSHAETRAFPIKFALAEFMWIMSKSRDLGFIYKYNKAMSQYSDDGCTLFGAYGYRLGYQIEECMQKMVNDKHTRQAVATIYDREDVFAETKDLPCNINLQFIIRNNALNLIVTSRSSDFMTGLPIDAFHWQLLLVLVGNQLLATYSDLQIGDITYNIASLHVYEADANLIDDFFHNDMHCNFCREYQHKLNISDTFAYARYRSKDFVDNEANWDLYDNFIFDVHSQATLLVLQDIFKNRKNKIVKTDNN